MSKGKAVSTRLDRRGTKRGFLLVFFSIFFLVGLVVSHFLLIRPLYQLHLAKNWSETPCTVISSQVKEHRGDDGDTYSIEIVYRYEVAGRSYQSDRYNFFSGSSSGRLGKQAVVDRYPPGKRTVCYVDPNDPSQAVLNRRFSAVYLIGLFPLVFVLFGGVGLLATLGVIRFGRRKQPPDRMAWQVEPIDRDRRSPRAMELDERERFAAAAAGPVVLQPEFSPRKKLLLSIFVAAVWNVVVGGFGWFILSDLLRGRAGTFQWIAVVFLVPFALAGLGLIVWVAYCFLALFNPRPVLRVSAPAVPLGGSLQLSWTFSGNARAIERLQIWLHGKEHVSYTRGTSTYTDEETFAKMLIVDTTNYADIVNGEAVLTVPAGAMHSFNAPHNKVLWSIDVAGQIARWPDVDSSFPLLVLPHAADEET